MSSEDHDLLLTVSNDVKHIVEWTKSHTSDDDIRFDKVNKVISFHSKIVYGFLGVVAFIELVTKIFK